MTTPIVFAALTGGSPETVGTHSSSFTRLVGLATDAALTATTVGGFALGLFGALSGSSTGVYVQHITGTASASLAAASGVSLDDGAFDVDGYTVGGYGVASLAPLNGSAYDSTILTPPLGGYGDASFAGLSSTVVASVNLIGTHSSSFGALYGIGIEQSIGAETYNGYGIGYAAPPHGFSFEGEEFDGVGYASLVYPAGFVSISSGSFVALLSDTLPLDVGLKADVPPEIRDGLRMILTPSIRTHFVDAVRGSLDLADSIVFGWSVLFADTIDMAMDVSVSLAALTYAEDTLLAAGVVDTRMNAQVAVIDALVMQELLAQGISLSLVDSLTVDDDIVPALQRVATMLDGLVMDGDAAAALRIIVLTEDGVDLGETWSTQMVMQEAMADGLQMFVAFRLGDVEYSCWALNTSRTAEGPVPAVVEFQNFPFNSFCEFDGRFFGASEHGLFELVGDTDNGDEIAAYVRAALRNVGTSIKKRAPAFYLGYKSDNSLVLKVVHTESGEKVEDWYAVEPRTMTDTNGNRVKIGRGLKSTYWGWELHNVDGADFALDVVEMFPLVTNRRV